MKPRKVAHWYEDFQKSSQRRRDFYDDESQGTPLSTTSEVERGFVWSWCEDRFLEDTFPVVALTYWVRCKAKIAVNFLLDEKNKELLLTDAEFEKVFGKTKEAFAKEPAFKKPLTKKKLGLGPYQFNE